MDGSDFSIGVVSRGFQQRTANLDPNDLVIGIVDMARRANDNHYFRLYFTPQELIYILVPTYFSGRGGLAAKALKTASTYGNRRTFSEQAEGITHGIHVKTSFERFVSCPKSEIVTINVKRGLGDYVLTIELPMKDGTFGKKKDIRKFLIDKKEYKNLKEFLPKFYGDIAAIK